MLLSLCNRAVLIKLQIDFPGIYESDSDSSTGENHQEQDNEDEHDENIPMSDLEDLDEEEK